MSRQLLKEYIKKAVREKIEREKRVQANRERSIYLIYKFPGLRKVFEDLMSPAFSRFLKEVKIVAPKPTTFNITLINDLEFTVHYSDKKIFVVKVEGKKYFMNNISDIQRASQAITGLLELNYAEDEVAAGKSGEEAQKAADLKASLGGGSSGGAPPIGAGSTGSIPGPGIDPNAPADATIPGAEEPGAEIPGEEPISGIQPDEDEEETEPKL